MVFQLDFFGRYRRATEAARAQLAGHRRRTTDGDPTGDLLDEEQAPAAKKEDVFKALGQMANRFRTRAAESWPPVEKEPSQQTEVTTPSLEAWKSYSAAVKAFSTQGHSQRKSSHS